MCGRSNALNVLLENDISSDFTFVPQPKYTQAEWRDNLHLSASGAVRMLRAR